MAIDLAWPLMLENIQQADVDKLIDFLSDGSPMLTQSRQVQAFESEWSEWLGVEHSVFVNSGSSANLLTIAALKELHGVGEVIVPTLTWVSDIATVIQCGLKPVFVDIDPHTLGMDNEQVLERITSETRAVFLTHVLGYNALTLELLDELQARGIPLIEDVCESYGATFDGCKLGSLGWVSNFSFYYAHHMSTIEGGMISTNDPDLYQALRMLRSHGMVREANAPELRDRYYRTHPDLNPDFIFAYPGYNVRSTEINAVIGRSQLQRLDANNEIRTRNLELFLAHLDADCYFTDFKVEGSCNYAFTLVLREADEVLCANVMEALKASNVEFRRGTAGGGNQLRQPYLQDLVSEVDRARFPMVDHVHFFGFYIGNYPVLEEGKILQLCRMLNDLATGEAR